MRATHQPGPLVAERQAEVGPTGAQSVPLMLEENNPATQDRARTRHWPPLASPVAPTVTSAHIRSIRSVIGDRTPEAAREEQA